MGISLSFCVHNCVIVLLLHNDLDRNVYGYSELEAMIYIKLI